MIGASIGAVHSVSIKHNESKSCCCTDMCLYIVATVWTHVHLVGSIMLSLSVQYALCRQLCWFPFALEHNVCVC